MSTEQESSTNDWHLRSNRKIKVVVLAIGLEEPMLSTWEVAVSGLGSIESMKKCKGASTRDQAWVVDIVKQDFRG